MPPTEPRAEAPGRFDWAAEAATLLFAAAAGIAAWGLRLDRADLAVPFAYDGDALPIFYYAKTLAENPWHLTNPATGAPVGLAAAAGLLLLMGRALTGPRDEQPVLDAAARLALAGLLYALAGGFAPLLAWISPMIRAPSRICVFLAFFALLGLGVAASRWRWRRSPAGWAAAWLALLAFGAYDQTSPRFALDPARAAAFRHDRAFVARLEAALPEAARVFQLPYVGFPEGPSQGTLGYYEPLRGYLHSRALRWSFGAIKGRATAAWQQRVAELPPAAMRRELLAAGFAAVWIDRRGYAPMAAAAIEAELRRTAGEPLLDAAGQRAAYLLQP